MKYIAHRGLFDGPNKEKENHPDQINLALKAGFEVELDLWLVYNNLMLGHDEPQYKVERDFFEQEGLWIHAKNLDALLWLTTTDYNYFWHQEDDFVITSHHYIWTYPGKPLTGNSIYVLPENVDSEFKNVKSKVCAGICSKFIRKIQDKIVST
jgi:hypothetical protein